MNRDYIIKYTILDKEGKVLKKGKMRAKKKMSSFAAQVDFEKWCKKKYVTFGKLVVHSCYEDNNLSDMFNDIFKKDNPFKF